MGQSDLLDLGNLHSFRLLLNSFPIIKGDLKFQEKLAIFSKNPSYFLNPLKIIFCLAESMIDRDIKQSQRCPVFYQIFNSLKMEKILSLVKRVSHYQEGKKPESAQRGQFMVMLTYMSLTILYQLLILRLHDICSTIFSWTF